MTTTIIVENWLFLQTRFKQISLLDCLSSCVFVVVISASGTVFGEWYFVFLLSCYICPLSPTFESPDEVNQLVKLNHMFKSGLNWQIRVCIWSCYNSIDVHSPRWIIFCIHHCMSHQSEWRKWWVIHWTMDCWRINVIWNRMKADWKEHRNKWFKGSLRGPLI